MAEPASDLYILVILDFCCRPVLYLPSPQKATVAVRCCPILFELRQDNGNIQGVTLASLLPLFHFLLCYVML